MLTLNIKGMTCGHCVKAVTQAIQVVDPSARVSIDLAQGRAEVETRADVATVVAAIAEAGYEAHA